MRFTLTIDCDNAAFSDDSTGHTSAGPELYRILTKLADRLSGELVEPGDSWPLVDSNGNRVGLASITDTNKKG